MKIHVPQGASAHAGFSSWTSSYLPATLGDYGSFIAAGLMALLFTTILVFLVEDAPADELSVSSTQSSSPSLSSPQKRNRNRKNLNLRLVGLAEHQNALDADFGGNDATYHSRYHISNGDEEDEDLKSPSPKFSRDFRTPQAHRSPPPPPIPQSRQAAFQALLQIPSLAAAAAAHGRGFPVDAKQPAQSEFRTPPASAPASISEVMAKAVNRRLLASPSPSPRTQAFTAVPPTTPVLSMAKLIMHRHDQFSKRPRRSPPPPPSPTSQANAYPNPSPSPTRSVFSTMQYTLKHAVPREGSVKSAANAPQEDEPPISPMRSGFQSPSRLSMSINSTPESGNGTTRDARPLSPIGLSPPPLRISKLSSQQVAALVNMVSSASPSLPSPKSSPSLKRGPISARGNLSKALAMALDRQQSSFPITFTPIEPDAPAEMKLEAAPPLVQEKPQHAETTQKQLVGDKNEEDSFQLVKPKSKGKGRRMRRRPSTTLEEGGR